MKKKSIMNAIELKFCHDFDSTMQQLIKCLPLWSILLAKRAGQYLNTLYLNTFTVFIHCI